MQCRWSLRNEDWLLDFIYQNCGKAMSSLARPIVCACVLWGGGGGRRDLPFL